MAGFLRGLFYILLFGVGIAGMAIPMWRFGLLALQQDRLPRLTDLESFMMAIFLTVASLVVSWAIAHHYARAESEAKATQLIDNVGEQSAEKSLTQSRQLWELEQYVYAKKEVLLENGEDQVGPVVLDSVAQLIRTIRTSNMVLVNDWAAVTSRVIGHRIREQGNKQAQLFDRIDAVNRSGGEDGDTREQLASEARELPSHIAPSVAGTATKVVESVLSTSAVATEVENTGTVKVTTLRPIKSFTAMARIAPSLASQAATKRITLTQSPPGAPSNVSALITMPDRGYFNVHLTSKETGPLPAGTYEFRYSVSV